jgi:hypothetical protein
MGLNGTIALVVLLALGGLGRVNDWKILVIPAMILVMLVASARNKRMSPRLQAALQRK